MIPLALNAQAARFDIPGGLGAHIESALALGLPEFQPALCGNDGTFVVVGSGPSLAQFPEEIRKEKAKGRPICAVNKAHDWLIDKGIEPSLFVTLDPRDTRFNVQRETERTTYLIASRCHPELFAHLKSRHVVLWHAASAEEENEVLARNRVPNAVMGVSTSGLRAINLGRLLGFRKFILYGMDSCNAPDGITKRVDGSLSGQTTEVIVGSTGRKFICNIAMALQAEDFQKLYLMMPDVEIEARGDGLLAAIIEERNRLRMERLRAA